MHVYIGGYVHACNNSIVEHSQIGCSRSQVSEAV